jgi:hypothetical protein
MRLLPLTALLLGVACCGTPQNPKAGQVGSGGADAPRSDAAVGTPRRIVGEVERVEARRRMKIWGKVEAIRKAEHGELPPLTTTAAGGVGDPVTEIRNQTADQLTVWFAGKCSHQVDVPATANVTAVFCPGTYNIAAMLGDKNFLPLVREDQEFTAGMQYRLDFFVEKAPSVTKKKKVR